MSMSLTTVTSSLRTCTLKHPVVHTKSIQLREKQNKNGKDECRVNECHRT